MRRILGVLLLAVGSPTAGPLSLSPPVTPEQLFARASESVFVVEALDSRGMVSAFGSGVAVNKKDSRGTDTDLIVTNRHIVTSGERLRVRRGTLTWKALLLKCDSRHDLCVLRAAGLSAPVPSIRAAATLRVGERVYAIGNPRGLELTLSEGLVSGLRLSDEQPLIQTTASVSPGSSGGGLFDSDGRLVGITTFNYRESQNLNFAVPSEWILEIEGQRVSDLDVWTAPPASGNAPGSVSSRHPTQQYAKSRATIHTDLGNITIKFFYDKAPHHVQNFVDLAMTGFYNGTMFHRVIPGFMIQGGDPNTRKPENPMHPYGTGGNVVDGKEVRLNAEFNDVSHRRGIISMARASDPNSASSQFFIVVKDSSFLDHQYSAFGEVVSGMEVVDKICSSPRDARDRPRQATRVRNIEVEVIGEDL